MNKSKVKRILIITLSNTGDIILTTPAIENIFRAFPGALTDIMAGPNGEEIFKHHKRVRRVFVYNKKAPFVEKFKLFLKLKRENYDLVADFRNTILPLVLGTRYKTAPHNRSGEKGMHKKDVHLSRLKDMGVEPSGANFEIPVRDDDKKSIDRVLKDLGVKNFVVLNPGAKSHVKRWHLKKFAALADAIKETTGCEVVLIGDRYDSVVIERVLFYMKTKPVNLLEKTNIRELSYLIRKAELLITNDSAPLHIASITGCSTLAFFGPTDEKKYGPFTLAKKLVMRKNLKCAPCEVAQCVNFENKYECLKSISVEEALAAVKELLGNAHTLNQNR